MRRPERRDRTEPGRRPRNPRPRRKGEGREGRERTPEEAGVIYEVSVLRIPREQEHEPGESEDGRRSGEPERIAPTPTVPVEEAGGEHFVGAKLWGDQQYQRVSRFKWKKKLLVDVLRSLAIKTRMAMVISSEKVSDGLLIG